MFAHWGPDFEYDASGSLVKNPNYSESSVRTEKYNLLSNNSVPEDIHDRGILAAAVKKIQDLEARLAALESS